MHYREHQHTSQDSSIHHQGKAGCRAKLGAGVVLVLVGSGMPGMIESSRSSYVMQNAPCSVTL
jgi:hypothetical protein